METAKVKRAYGKNRVKALSYFTSEEQAIIERHMAKSTELGKLKNKSCPSYERGQERKKQLSENYRIALKEGLFEAAGISLEPGTFRSRYEKQKMGEQLLMEYRESHPSNNSQIALLSPSPPSVLVDPTLGEPICT